MKKGEIGLLTLMSSFDSILKQRLLKTGLQAIDTIASIVKEQGKILEEEWELIFNFINAFIHNRQYRKEKQGFESIKKIFNELKYLYITQSYKGSIQTLMETFTQAKDIINDKTFDALYLNYLIKDPEDLKAKLPTFIKILLEPQGSIYDSRISVLFSTLNDIYTTTSNMRILTIIEEIVIADCKEWLDRNLYCDKLLMLLKIIALKTLSFDVFSAIIQIIGDIIIQVQYVVDTTKPKDNLSVVKNDEDFRIEAQRILLQLFSELYLSYPPSKVMCVVNELINSIKSKDESIKLLALEFFSEISFDKHYFLNMNKWNASSYLSAFGKSNFTFDNLRRIVTEQVLHSDNNKTIIKSLSTLTSIITSHHSLYRTNINETVELLIPLLSTKIKRYEVKISIKIIKLLSLLTLQKGNIMVFDKCLYELESIALIIKNDTGDAIKYKVIKKIGNQVFRTSQAFIKPKCQKLAKVITPLIKLLCKIFYTMDIVDNIEKLIRVFKIYVDNQMLAEKFVMPIQNAIFNLYVSGIMAKLSIRHLADFIEICLKFGWRNDLLFYKQLPLSVYFSLYELPVHQVNSKKPAEYSLDEIRSKGRSIEYTYFPYQCDSSYQMHQLVMNIMRIFMFASKNEREIIYNYTVRILRQEIVNIDSPIIYQSKILLKLLSWYCYTNIERSIKPEEEGTNMWIMKDTIFIIQTKSNEAIIEFRNIVSHNSMNVKIKEPPFKPQQSSNEALSILSNIRNNKEVSYVLSKEPTLISPEYLLNHLPCTFPFVVDGKTWNNYHLNSEIKECLKLLDSIPVYNVHTVCLLYIPSHSNFELEQLFNVKTWSEEFEIFMSKLGSVIDIKSCVEGCECIGLRPKYDGHGIFWRDNFSHLLFHINVLMQSEDTKTFFENDSVCVLWNESEEKLPKKFFSSSMKIGIVITPYPDKYYQVEILKVV